MVLGHYGPGLASLWEFGDADKDQFSGEMAVLCETNHPLLRQLPIPPSVRGANSVLAVHLPALLLCLVQVAKGNQRCSFSPVLLCCRKRPKEMKNPGKERPVHLQNAL